MRFDDLFDDLESQLEAELGAASREVADEEERFRVGRLELRDRLRAVDALDVSLRSGTRLRVKTMSIGRDWVSGEVLDGAADGTGAVIPLSAIAAVRYDEAAAIASTAPAEERIRLADRLSLGYVLRDFARRRIWVGVEGASPVGGTVDRVGRDHFDVAVHEYGSIRARGNVAHIAVVPFAAVDWIRLRS